MKVMQPLREFGTPLADISQPMPYNGCAVGVRPLFPMGKLQSYWKAQNLRALPDEATEIIADRVNQRPSPLTLVVTFQMGGAINRVGARDGLHRAFRAMDVVGRWQLGQSGGQPEEHRVGARELPS